MMTVISGCETAQPIDISQIQYQGTGEIVDYHPNGRLKRKTEFVDGNLVKSVSFFASGTRASEEQFAEGALTNAVYYFTSGEVKTRVGNSHP
jgi:antitoxin component YwqK of YwqJK toxin-antitoxin module